MPRLSRCTYENFLIVFVTRIDLTGRNCLTRRQFPNRLCRELVMHNDVC